MAAADEVADESNSQRRWGLPEGVDEDIPNGDPEPTAGPADVDDSSTVQGPLDRLPNPQNTQSVYQKSKWHDRPRVTETPFNAPWASQIAQEQTSFLTSTYEGHNPYRPTDIPSLSSSVTASGSTTTGTGDPKATRIPPLGGSKPGGFNGINGGRAVVAGMVIGAIIVLVALLIAFCCLARRSRSRKRRVLAAGASRAGMRPTETFRHEGSSLMTPLPTAQPSSDGVLPAHATATTTTQPLILGPITNGYNTGLDSQSILSGRQGSLLTDPFADIHSVSSEIPPSYQASRPPSYRTDPTPSVAMSDEPPSSAASHQPGLRRPFTTEAESQRYSTVERADIGQSPFAHADDGDAVSELSASALERGRDSLSVVSEMSYQQDPIRIRFGVIAGRPRTD
ncbi:uncharacterized protein EI97DRAFT_314814 [Westerdykella ornata]|uniref:Uncharacterized protein n=1 Tax=Westerdykella ornata TaxID=318751 RepID=A0A6A6JL06_WESOR|nr:uncharacterized protein EI97DRAFT_314814 [Westerdykella ornata]KAF2277271.1 hypothetical protein EI97DRAFT_314814 [Westerdykella ornata]